MYELKDTKRQTHIRHPHPTERRQLCSLVVAALKVKRDGTRQVLVQSRRLFVLVCVASTQPRSSSRQLLVSSITG
jgi:hypothetical protein